MPKIYIILFFIFVSNNLHSQYYLELKKASQTKSFKFFPGEKISELYWMFFFDVFFLLTKLLKLQPQKWPF